LCERNGVKHTYTGAFTTDSLVHWVNKQSNPLIIPVDKCDDLSTKVTYSSLSLVYFGAATGELYHSFARAARANEKYLYFLAGSDCAESYETVQNSITAFRSFGRP